MKASISFLTTTGFMPIDAYTSRARSCATTDVDSPLTTSTSGSR